MRGTVYVGLLLAAWIAPAFAQAPAAGSGGGGGVGASVSEPTTPKGAAPPGTPSGQSTAERQSRDAIGTAVIGKTETSGTAMPGDTGGADSGVKK